MIMHWVIIRVVLDGGMRPKDSSEEFLKGHSTVFNSITIHHPLKVDTSVVTICVQNF